MNDETKKLMELPRCGVPDVFGPEENARRKKRFNAQGSAWRNRVCKYDGKVVTQENLPRGDRLLYTIPYISVCMELSTFSIPGSGKAHILKYTLVYSLDFHAVYTV